MNVTVVVFHQNIINTIDGEFTVTRIDTLPNDVVEVIVPDTVTKIVRSCKYYNAIIFRRIF